MIESNRINEFEINAFTLENVDDIPIKAGYINIDNDLKEPAGSELIINGESIDRKNLIYVSGLWKKEQLNTLEDLYNLDKDKLINGYKVRVLEDFNVYEYKDGDWFIVDVPPGRNINYWDVPFKCIELDENNKSKYYFVNTTYNTLNRYDLSKPITEVNPWVPQHGHGKIKGADGDPTQLSVVDWTIYGYDVTDEWYNVNEEGETLLWRRNDENTKWLNIGVIYAMHSRPEEFSYDVFTLNQDIYYFDDVNTDSLERLFMFDYTKYFVPVDYSGNLYEKQFQFYHDIMNTYIDFNDNDRVNYNDVIYIGSHPELVIKTPVENQVYIDSNSNKVYLYVNDSFKEVKQAHRLVPYKIFYL